jgi:hypothetical protein
MEEGLDRHDAIHAIGSVLAAHLHDVTKAEESAAPPQDAYFAELDRLTAASWRRGFS